MAANSGSNSVSKSADPRGLFIIAALSLTLVGCMSEGNDIFHHSEAVTPEPPSADQAVPQVAPTPNVPLSPAAKAAAPAGENLSRGELLDCVTESCKINCSPKVAKQFRPKWCVRFKEPAE